MNKFFLISVALLSIASVTVVSLDSQIRYYTGLDILPQAQLYLRYGTIGQNLENRILQLNKKPKFSDLILDCSSVLSLKKSSLIL